MELGIFITNAVCPLLISGDEQNIGSLFLGHAYACEFVNFLLDLKLANLRDGVAIKCNADVASFHVKVKTPVATITSYATVFHAAKWC